VAIVCSDEVKESLEQFAGGEDYRRCGVRADTDTSHSNMTLWSFLLGLSERDTSVPLARHKRHLNRLFVSK